MKYSYIIVFILVGCLLNVVTPEEGEAEKEEKEGMVHQKLCKRDEIGTEVEEAICDNSKCQKMSIEDLKLLGSQPGKVYTWNTAHKFLVGYCPIKYSYAVGPVQGDSPVILSFTYTIHFGKSCVSVGNVTVPLTAVPDASGQFTTFKKREQGEEWEICHPLYIPKGPFVIRACRRNPAPKPGTAFASLLVVEPATGNCHRDATNEFLETYEANWEELTVDCV